MKSKDILISITRSFGSNYNFFTFFQSNKANKLYYSVNFNKIKTALIHQPLEYEIFINKRVISKPLAAFLEDYGSLLNKSDYITVFTIGGPEISEYVIELIFKNIFTNMLPETNIKFIFASNHYVNKHLSLYDDYSKMLFLQESVRNYMYNKSGSPLFGGWKLIDKNEMDLYVDHYLLKSYTINHQKNISTQQLAKIYSTKINKIIFGTDKLPINYDALLEFTPNTELLCLLAVLLINPRYFVAQPYLCNFYRVYNYLGLIKFDALDTIYKNKSNYKQKLLIRSKILDLLFDQNQPKPSSEKELLKKAKSKLWKILSVWINSQMSTNATASRT
jgi:hypothetical protein